MHRSDRSQPHLTVESRGSGAFGLADVLEPDLDPEAATSMMRIPVRSVRLPAQLEDFAFADTICASGRDDGPPPPSGPIFVNDEPGARTQCVTPLAYPHPGGAAQRGTIGRLLALSALVSRAARRSMAEMGELWAGTAEVIEGGASPAPRSSPFVRLLRRLLALWSFFQWSRTDFARAALIGMAVLTTAGVVFALTLGAQAGPWQARTEVRPGHTLDRQHTDARIVVRTKR